MPSKIKRRLIIGFFSSLYLIFLVLKVVFTLHTADFVDFNARNTVQIENIIRLKKNYSFIAVGNVMNSIGVFERELIPLMNASQADFVVFTGNALLDGANDKYAALYRTLNKLNKPVLFTIGDREISDSGLKNYFKHIGSPLFFFTAGDSEFIFLDTSGYTDEQFQMDWLDDILNNFQKRSSHFIFMNRSPVLNSTDSITPENHYAMSPDFKNNLLESFSRGFVTAVISSSSGDSDVSRKDGTTFIATGGGGWSFVLLSLYGNSGS